MSYRVSTKLLAILVMAIISLATAKPSAWASTATVSSTPSQTLKGWGLLQSYLNEAGDGTGSMWTRPTIQNTIYNDGVTVLRTMMDPKLYVSGGASVSDIVIDPTQLSYLVHGVQMAVSHGVTSWTLTPWTPPVSMKCSGTTLAGHLNVSSEAAYVNYFTAVIIAVHNQGLPYPVYVSIENEPVTEGTTCGTTGNWDHSNFIDVAQYIRVVEAMRSSFDTNGLSSVKIFGPESSEYQANIINDNWLGGSTFSNLNDATFSNALSAYAWHSYTTGLASDVASGVALHPKDCWMTEWTAESPNQGTTDMDWTIAEARHVGGDLVDVPNNYLFLWHGWAYGLGSPGSEDLLVGDQTPIYSKRYYLWQKIWNTVRPGWVVKKMTTDDPDLQVAGANSDYDVKVDLYAFECAAGTKTAVVLSNWTTGSKSITVNGLKGNSYSTFVTDGTRDMVNNANGAVTAGSAAITLPSYSVTVMTTDPAPNNSKVLNCGGSALGSWADDANYAGGTAAFTAWNIDTTGVTNPAPNEVYETERYGTMTYTLQGMTANSAQTLRLHFCENYWSAAGQRTFNVSINGTQVLTNFDIFATAGAQHKAVAQQFNTTADSNGKVAIVFTSVINNALINGIEVLGPPNPPTNLAAAAGDTNVALTWAAAGSATSYNVYRGTAPGGESATAIATGITGTSYSNTGLANGAAYYYTVKSVNSLGTSGASNEASATPASTFKINAGGPASSPFSADMDFAGGLTAANWTGTIDTSAVTSPAPQAVYQPERYGAMTYTIPNLRASTSYTVRLHFCENYFTASGSRKFNVTIQGTQVLTSFDVYANAGAAHKATVQQFSATSDANGNIAIAFTNVTDNAEINGIEVLGASSPPTTPTGLTATAGNAQVALSWNASSGATSYNVKRSTVSGSGYVTVASPSTNSYTNTGLTNGTTYYFVVSAVNGAGESGNSTQASAKPMPPIPPTPTGLTATPGNTQAALSWSASSSATSYNVKRATVSGGPYTTVASPATTSYTNTGLTNGTTYYYVVSAVDLSGESANSSQVSAKPTAGTIISVNFIGNNTAMGATESAGVVAATNWNNETGAAQATAQALLDNAGSSTGATITWSAIGTWALPITDAAGNVRMMKGYLDSSNTSTTTVTISGLPAQYMGSGYDVIVYTDHDNATATRTANYTIGATTIPSTDNANTNFSGTFTQGFNFVRFTSLTGASFTLSATPSTSTDGNLRAPVNGIQIVPHTAAINGGGPNATPFVADAYFSGGLTATNNTGAVDTSAVTNPAPAAVYQSERYGAMTYTIPGFVANSSHTVRLHFSEDYFTASGQRTFNVLIGGTQVLTNFDIFATAGAIHKANIQQFTTTANASGQVVIQFTNVINNAKIDGIEVI